MDSATIAATATIQFWIVIPKSSKSSFSQSMAISMDGVYPSRLTPTLRERQVHRGRIGEARQLAPGRLPNRRLGRRCDQKTGGLRWRRGGCGDWGCGIGEL